MAKQQRLPENCPACGHKLRRRERIARIARYRCTHCIKLWLRLRPVSGAGHHTWIEEFQVPTMKGSD